MLQTTGLFGSSATTFRSLYIICFYNSKSTTIINTISLLKSVLLIISHSGDRTTRNVDNSLNQLLHITMHSLHSFY